jgi:hypothetical protein
MSLAKQKMTFEFFGSAYAPTWFKKLFASNSSRYHGLFYTSLNWVYSRKQVADEVWKHRKGTPHTVWRNGEWLTTGHTKDAWSQGWLYNYGVGRRLWSRNAKTQVRFGLLKSGELSERAKIASETRKKNDIKRAAMEAYEQLPQALKTACSHVVQCTCDDHEDGGCGGSGKVETGYNSKAGMYGRSYYGDCPRCKGRGTWDVTKIDAEARDVAVSLWKATKDEAKVLEVMSTIWDDIGKPVESTEVKRERLADELGMPSDSQTVALALGGVIGMDEAKRRAEKIRFRHENTNYDSLLAAGVDRDEARLVCES